MICRVFVIFDFGANDLWLVVEGYSVQTRGAGRGEERGLLTGSIIGAAA